MASLPRLIALSPGTLVDGDWASFLDAVEQAQTAGLPGLLLREPHLSDRAYLALGRALHDGPKGRVPWLAVHDRAHLAAELGADALHLSYRSLRPSELRSWLHGRIQIGLSTHAGDETADWLGADYVFHGPLHATPSKAGLLEPVGLDGLERAIRAAPCPLFALGGVQPEDVPALVERGVHGVAVLSGCLGASAPAEATRAFLESFP